MRLLLRSWLLCAFGFCACAGAPPAHVTTTAPPPSPSSPTTPTTVAAAAPTVDFVIPIVSGEAYLERVVRTYGYQLAPASSADHAIVLLDDDPNAPRLLAWVRAEQARGRAVVAPAGAFEPRECPADGPCGVPASLSSVSREAAKLYEKHGLMKALPAM